MHDFNEDTARLAIMQTDGNLTQAAAMLRTTRSELWRRVKGWPKLAEMLIDLRESLVDDAEMLLREAMAQDKPWAIMFMLRTRGKNRGYAKPRQQRKGKKGKAQEAAGLNAEQLAEFQRVQAAAGGAAAGPEPEFCRQLDLADVRAALADSPGGLSAAAQKLGVSRESLVEYLTRRPALLNGAGDAREELADQAESLLREALAQKKPWAIRFVLKTLGRSRGYSEYDEPKAEWLPSPVGTNDQSSLSDEELARCDAFTEIMAGTTEDAPKKAESGKQKAEAAADAKPTLSAAPLASSMTPVAASAAAATPGANAATDKAEETRNRGRTIPSTTLVEATIPEQTPSCSRIRQNSGLHHCEEAAERVGNGITSDFAAQKNRATPENGAGSVSSGMPDSRPLAPREAVQTFEKAAVSVSGGMPDSRPLAPREAVQPFEKAGISVSNPGAPGLTHLSAPDQTPADKPDGPVDSGRQTHGLGVPSDERSRGRPPEIVTEPCTSQARNSPPTATPPPNRDLQRALWQAFQRMRQSGPARPAPDKKPPP